MIIVDNVHKRYQTVHGPGKWILQGVTFTIPPQVNVGLVGGNGAGKSTLLRLIGGIDTPNKGRIERHCRVSWPMGFGGGLVPSLTGRQNAKFVCRILGHGNEISEKLAVIQDFAEIGDAFDEPINTYSSGMKSRLQFGLSLAFDFDVYISDEITATGDAAFRKKAAAAFKKKTSQASLIMVSHGEGTLRQFCTAGIWLHDGQAYWFDNINDALKEYNKSQPKVKIAKPEPKPRIKMEMGRGLDTGNTEKNQYVMDILAKGVNGTPETVDSVELKKIIHGARKAGIILVGIRQLVKRGYILKPDATPILRKRTSARDTCIDLYDLRSQCVMKEQEDAK